MHGTPKAQMIAEAIWGLPESLCQHPSTCFDTGAMAGCSMGIVGAR